MLLYFIIIPWKSVSFLMRDRVTDPDGKGGGVGRGIR